LQMEVMTVQNFLLTFPLNKMFETLMIVWFFAATDSCLHSWAWSRWHVLYRACYNRFGMWMPVFSMRFICADCGGVPSMKQVVPFTLHFWACLLSMTLVVEDPVDLGS
jgi:hypothetical protein